MQASDYVGSVVGWGLGGFVWWVSFGLMRVVMLAWMSACLRGVHVRLVTMGTMSTCMPGQFEWSALARGCIFLCEDGGCPLGYCLCSNSIPPSECHE
jgi:hypothetical protein